MLVSFRQCRGGINTDLNIRTKTRKLFTILNSKDTSIRREDIFIFLGIVKKVGFFLYASRKKLCC